MQLWCISKAIAFTHANSVEFCDGTYDAHWLVVYRQFHIPLLLVNWGDLHFVRLCRYEGGCNFGDKAAKDELACDFEVLDGFGFVKP